MTQYNHNEDSADIIAALIKRVEALERAPRLQNATIDKGALQIKSVDGKPVAVFGDLVAAGVQVQSGLPPVRADGSPQMGSVLWRDNGVAAFFVWDPDPVAGGYQQYWTLADITGKGIVAEDALAGYGLALPWIPVSGNMMNMDPTKWPATTATTWTEAWVGDFFVQHPKLFFDANLYCNGTMLGASRVLVDGVQYGPTVTGTAAGYTLVNWVATLPQSLMGRTVYISIQHMVTSGTTGSVATGVRGCYGRQS